MNDLEQNNEPVLNSNLNTGLNNTGVKKPSTLQKYLIKIIFCILCFVAIFFILCNFLKYNVPVVQNSSVDKNIEQAVKELGTLQQSSTVIIPKLATFLSIQLSELPSSIDTFIVPTAENISLRKVTYQNGLSGYQIFYDVSSTTVIVFSDILFRAVNSDSKNTWTIVGSMRTDSSGFSEFKTLNSKSYGRAVFFNDNGKIKTNIQIVNEK